MLIDLTCPINKNTKEFPGDLKYQQAPCLTVGENGFSVHAILINSHFGTHLDAPRHAFETAPGIDSIPLKKLYGSACCLPLDEHGLLDCQRSISLKMLLPYASLFCPGAKILIRTGWGSLFGTDEYFQHAPFLSKGVVDFIAGRKIDLIGFDLPSPGNEETNLGAHQKLLAAKIVIVENLINLEQLPSAPKSFTFCAAPIPVENMDGFPVRAFADIS